MSDNSYSILRIEKKKNTRALGWAYAHNYRTNEFAAPHADKEQSYKNQELIRDDFGVADRNFVKIYKKKVKASPYYKKHPVRKNAVPAIEVLLGFSKEKRDGIDLDKWKAENVSWLQETFGKENVISAVFHDDEKDENDPNGTGCHIHAVIIPMDERGCLNASEMIGNKAKLHSFQTDYAKRMELFGLVRGDLKSTDRHVSPKEFHNKVDDELGRINSMLPVPEKNESAIDYRKRIQEPLWEVARDKTEMILEYERKELLRKEKERKAKLDKKLDDQLKEIQDAKAARKMEKDEKELREMLGLGDGVPTKEQMHEAKKKIRIANNLAEAFQIYPDHEFAVKVNEDMATIMKHHNKVKKERERTEKKNI